MDEQIPDPDPDIDLQAEEYEENRQERFKEWTYEYFRAKHPHLRQPYDPWIRPTEGETP